MPGRSNVKRSVKNSERRKRIKAKKRLRMQRRRKTKSQKRRRTRMKRKWLLQNFLIKKFITEPTLASLQEKLCARFKIFQCWSLVATIHWTFTLIFASCTAEPMTTKLCSRTSTRSSSCPSLMASTWSNYSILISLLDKDRHCITTLQWTSNLTEKFEWRLISLPNWLNPNTERSCSQTLKASSVMYCLNYSSTLLALKRSSSPVTSSLHVERKQ